MDMKVWLHCNVGCGQSLRSNSSVKFVFSNCGHVLCEPCAKKVEPNCCPVCKKSAKMVLMTDQAPQDIKTLFMDPAQLIGQQENQLKQLQQQQLQLISQQENQLKQLQQQQTQLQQQQTQLQQQQKQQQTQLQQQQMQLLQQQKQRLSQLISFQKLQIKSYLSLSERTIQRQLKKEKALYESLKVDYTKQQQTLNALQSREKDYSPRHAGSSNPHLSGVFQPVGSTGKSPSFNQNQEFNGQQRSAFVQNSLFGGNKLPTQQSNGEYIRGSGQSTDRQLQQQHGQIRASLLTRPGNPSGERNTGTGIGQSNRVHFGSFQNMNQEVLSTTPAGPGRFLQPAPVNNVPMKHRRLSMARNSLLSPASGVGSSVIGIGAASPSISVVSDCYLDFNKRFP